MTSAASAREVTNCRALHQGTHQRVDVGRTAVGDLYPKIVGRVASGNPGRQPERGLNQRCRGGWGSPR